MEKTVSFQEILALFETNGWKLKKIKGKHRVFVKAGSYICFPVHNHRVRIEYVEKCKQYISEIG
jgi:predicted RNA binding protein YcfA (HicA-like mRNA interferase family)